MIDDSTFSGIACLGKSGAVNGILTGEFELLAAVCLQPNWARRPVATGLTLHPQQTRCCLYWALESQTGPR